MATVAASEEGMTAAPQEGQKRLGAVSSVAQEGQRSMGKPWIYFIKIIVGQAVGQAIAFRGLSCFAEAQTLGVGRPILAAAGFSRLPVLPSPATSRLPHFFMRFRGPKALCNRRQKPIICSTFDARPTFDSHARAACQRISRGTSSTLATPQRCNTAVADCCGSTPGGNLPRGRTPWPPDRKSVV